jgi:hypothetical protein
MKSVLLVISVALLLPGVARASLSGDAQLTPSANGGGWHYDAVLQNTGDTTVGTFWYAWVPGEDFLATSPTNVTSPTGWQAAITHFPNISSNGYAIQWKATSAADDLAAGGTLSGFGFDTTDTPAALMGDSVFYPGTPVGTSFVYSGAPFSDDGFEFIATTKPAPTPEPASLALLAVGGTLLFRRRR